MNPAYKRFTVYDDDIYNRAVPTTQIYDSYGQFLNKIKYNDDNYLNSFNLKNKSIKTYGNTREGIEFLHDGSRTRIPTNFNERYSDNTPGFNIVSFQPFNVPETRGNMYQGRFVKY